MAQSCTPASARRPLVLLTRPLAGSLRFAELLREHMGADLPIVISPLMALSFVVPDMPDRQFEAVLFTSEAGVAAVSGGRLTDLPRRALCVGDATAEAARIAGFEAQSAGGDAPALIAMVKTAGLRGPLLHLRGETVTGDVARQLTAVGIETVELIVYRQSPLPLDRNAIAVLQRPAPVIAPLFSPRSARLFASAVRAIDLSAPLSIVALSPAVAVEIRPLHPVLAVVAAEPHAVSMVQAVADLMAGNPPS